MHIYSNNIFNSRMARPNTGLNCSMHATSVSIFGCRNNCSGFGNNFAAGFGFGLGASLGNFMGRMFGGMPFGGGFFGGMPFGGGFFGGMPFGMGVFPFNRPNTSRTPQFIKEDTSRLKEENTPKDKNKETSVTIENPVRKKDYKSFEKAMKNATKNTLASLRDVDSEVLKEMVYITKDALNKYLKKGKIDASDVLVERGTPRITNLTIKNLVDSKNRNCNDYRDENGKIVRVPDGTVAVLTFNYNGKSYQYKEYTSKLPSKK